MIRSETEVEGFPLTAIREIRLLEQMNPQYCVQLLEIVTSTTSIYLVFEYFPWDLAALMLHPEVRFAPDQIKCLMQQLLTGLAYLHDRSIIHRDIKCSNLLLSYKGRLKFADFGLARLQPTSEEEGRCLTNRVITIWYRPPELLLGSTDYGWSVDMWSVGCIFAELHLKRAPFTGNDEISQLEAIFEALGAPTEKDTADLFASLPLSPMYRFSRHCERKISETLAQFKDAMSAEAWNLFRALVQLNPKSRVSARDALYHPYFRQEPPAACPQDRLSTLLPEDWHEWEGKQTRKRQHTASGSASGCNSAVHENAN